jgi:hypothetical protein
MGYLVSGRESRLSSQALPLSRGWPSPPAAIIHLSTAGQARGGHSFLHLRAMRCLLSIGISYLLAIDGLTVEPCRYDMPHAVRVGGKDALIAIDGWIETRA